MKRCIYCGHENEAAATTCAMCGNRLVDVPEDGTAPIEEVPDEEIPAGDAADAQIPDIQIAEAEAETDNIDVAGETVEEPSPASDDDAQVMRGQTYAAQQQYDQETPAQPYGGQDYGYEVQEDGSAQYGGQAYGYDHDPSEIGETDDTYGADLDDGISSPVILEKSRRRVHSFLFFLVALLYTVKTLAGILNGIAPYLPMPFKEMGTHLTTYENTLINWFGQNDAIHYLHNGISMMNGVDPLIILGSTLLAFVPAIFIMIGFWMAFGGIRPDEEEISTSGLTMIRVWEILKMIVVCVALGAAIVFAVAYVVAAGASSSPMALIVGIVALLIVIILAVLVIMYFVQLIFSIRMVRRNVRRGDDIGKMPGYLIFVGFVMLALTVLCIIPMDPSEIIGLVALGSEAAFLFFILIWAIVYRVTVKAKRS
ncbi:MAG: hypothetical protein IJI24_09890 [Lachnospiraceae bacterium]|nr:hypothetical protein [Lachnospiraceae bacterium]